MYFILLNTKMNTRMLTIDIFSDNLMENKAPTLKNK